MSFLDFFRPKWRNSDAEIRAEAVRQLGDDDLTLLTRIVRQDGDAKVRRIALKKIGDPTLLGELAESDPDESLRKAAADKATELLVAAAVAGGNPSRSLAALEKIKGDRALADVAKRAADPDLRCRAVDRIVAGAALFDVARNADDADLRKRAVERIDDLGNLRDVAIHDQVKEVGLAALAKISDDGALELILKRAKSKAVKAAARERLSPTVGETPTSPARPSSKSSRQRAIEVSPEARQRALLAQACHLAEEAAKLPDLEAAEARLSRAREAMAELGGAVDDDHKKRFEKAAGRVTARRQDLDRQSQLFETEAAEKARRAVEAEDRAKRESEERIARDATRTDEEKAEAAAKDAAREAARIEREKHDAERSAERAKRESEKVLDKERRDAEQAAGVARLVELCVSLEALSGSDDQKQTEAALKTAEAAFQSTGPLRGEHETVRERFQAARSKLVIRLQELREAEDWRRWANVPRFEGLCVKMEALAKDEALDAREKAKQLKAMQAEWKSCGPAPREKSEALWARFKAAGDLAYGKTQENLAVLDEERAANLKKKEDLCVQVEALGAASEPEKTAAWTGVEWKETAEKFKKLQEEWKAIGPVAKGDTDALWKRFRTPCDQFFERRKGQLGQVDEERAGNLKRLEELCVRAESLSGSMEFKETGEKVKALQAEWKEVGTVGRKESEASWKRFREACDKFFARRKAHFDKLDSERAANLVKKEAMCVAVEAEVASEQAPPDEHAAVELIRKHMADWKKIGPAPRETADAVWERFRKACDGLRDKARGEVPEAELPAAEIPQASGPPSKFDNKLPLADLAAEWDRLAEGDEPADGVAPEPIE